MIGDFEDLDQSELLSVKEFSDFTGVSQTTLRYWDDIGLFTPAQRNPDTGYRYYSPLQIITINFVSVLSTLGIPLKSIAAVESNRTPERILDMLETHENILDMEIRRLQECHSIIHARRDLIRTALSEDENEISVCRFEDMPIIMGSPNDFTGHRNFYKVFMQFCNQSKPLRMNLSYPIGGYFTAMKAFMENPGQPTCFFTVDPMGYEKRPAGEYLVGCTRGYYGNMNDLPKRMEVYAREHSLSFTGSVYVIYPHDELSIENPGQYLSKAIVGVTKR